MPPTLDTIESALRLAAAVCAHYEGCKLRPYTCPAGVVTIGYGTTVYPGGRRVSLQDAQITEARARELLELHLRAHCLPDVQRLCPGLVDFGRLAAVLSWTYNCGEGALEKSTMRQHINAGRWLAAGVEMRKWNKGGGVVLNGLVRRRAEESRMLEGGGE